MEPNSNQVSEEEILQMWSLVKSISEAIVGDIPGVTKEEVAKSIVLLGSFAPNKPPKAYKPAMSQWDEYRNFMDKQRDEHMPTPQPYLVVGNTEERVYAHIGFKDFHAICCPEMSEEQALLFSGYLQENSILQSVERFDPNTGQREKTERLLINSKHHPILTAILHPPR